MKRIILLSASLLCGLLQLSAQFETAIQNPAGELNTLLTEQELSEVTNLTLSGTMDARDFQTMKDSMPKLISINLADATIAYYSGYNGTDYNSDRVYKADQIPHGAFTDYVEEVVLPNSVKTFDNSAFYGTVSLKEIVIPPLVQTIGYYAFNEAGIQSITIPSTVDTIGEYAFNHARSLRTVNIANGVKCIGNGAFYYAGAMENVIIPASVNTIEQNAFYFSEIHDIRFESDNLNLGSSAFYYCKNLRNVTFNTQKAVINSNAFYYCDSLEYLDFGKGVDSIYNGAFYHCVSIANDLTIPASCKFVDDVAFYYCQKIPKLIIEEGVDYIGSMSFGFCPGIVGEIEIPRNLNIGNGAFNSCTGIESLSFPETLGLLDNGAFFYCTSLKDIRVKAVPPIYISDNKAVFTGIDTPNVTLHVPYGSIHMYDTASVWKEFNMKEYADFEVSQDQFTVTYASSSVSFDLNTNANWRASASESWISLLDNQGNGSTDFSFQVEQNVSSKMRTGSIYFDLLNNSNEILSTQEVKVYQIGPVEVTQEIVLEDGWNLISLYVVTENMSIENIVPSQVTMVKNNDGFWNSTIMSSISDFVPGEGYFVYSKGKQTIVLHGVPAGL